MIKYYLAGMGIQYVPDKDVIVAELLCEQLEVKQQLLSKVREGQIREQNNTKMINMNFMCDNNITLTYF